MPDHIPELERRGDLIYVDLKALSYLKVSMASSFGLMKQPIPHLSSVYTYELPIQVSAVAATEAGYKERQLQSLSQSLEATTGL